MTTANMPRTLSASSIKGDTVKNTQDKELGKIEEVMLDLQSGRIAYLVLSFGGFLGINDKYFALPWEAFTISPKDDKVLLLDVDKDTLKNAPGFDKDNWPDSAQHDWLVDVYEYYGFKAYWV